MTNWQSRHKIASIFQNMDQRQAQFLCGFVREYIRAAEPLASTRLKELLELVVSPATVRSWMQDLEEDGFIEQPHVSAGRIPTDQGYRYYVDRVHPRREARTEGIEESPATLVRRLSQAAHALAIAALPSGRVEQYGLLELMLQPEGSNRHAMQEISSMLDHIHDYVEDLSQRNNPSRTDVFIGSENPCMIAVHTSMLVRAVADQSGRRSLVLLIGPKRMPYSRNIALLERVAAIL